LLSKQVLKFETFSLYKFGFCYCSSVLQSFAQGLYQMVLGQLLRLLVLSKNQQ